MSWSRIEAEGGLQWPCPDEDHPGSPLLHERLWRRPIDGKPAPFSCVEHSPPVDILDKEFPLRLTTGRVLDSYNTGVQTEKYSSPIRTGETLDISKSDAKLLGIVSGEHVQVTSRRGTIKMTINIDPDLPTGLAFTTFHFSESTDVNQLTNDAWDPKSGTAEFKATAIKIEKIINA